MAICMLGMELIWAEWKKSGFGSLSGSLAAMQMYIYIYIWEQFEEQLTQGLPKTSS